MEQHKYALKVSRLTGLTDGIFAIAMTILVLNLQLPLDMDGSDLSTFLKADVLQKLFIYAGSFIILGTQWIGISFQHGFLNHVNRPYLWFNIFFLMPICTIPFAANLLVEYPRSFISILFYAADLLCVSIGLFLTLQVSHYYKLCDPMYKGARNLALQRILFAPIFYIAAIIVAQWNTTIAFALLIIPPVVHIIPGKLDKYNEG